MENCWPSAGPIIATTWDSSVLIYDMERGEAKAMAQDAGSSGLAFRPGTHLLAYDKGLVDPAYFVNGQPDANKACGIFGTWSFARSRMAPGWPSRPARTQVIGIVRHFISDHLETSLLAALQ